MTKFLASISALAFAAGLAVAPQIASAQPAHAMGHHMRCPRGAHWIPAHRNRGGRWVPGHCGRR
ncbi:MAG TPA: hypothetical protein VHS78_12125 [Candidatus Elarobacter sp.]|jgi:hypothetical protein|nr:hypothetical protein [Candidatus Elarobacter sp.]